MNKLIIAFVFLLGCQFPETKEQGKVVSVYDANYNRIGYEVWYEDHIETFDNDWNRIGFKE